MIEPERRQFFKGYNSAVTYVKMTSNLFSVEEQGFRALSMSKKMPSTNSEREHSLAIYLN
ncbi:MAG: hypothetical protein R8G66_35210 [Cytophagales bacterium]|nr:hypothetical protein [Cytophagales bacterium]